MFEDMIDEAVEPFPAGAWFDGDDSGTHGDRPRDDRGGGFLDENRGRGTRGLFHQPAQHIVVADAEQQEHVGGHRRGGQTQPDVVRIDQGGRGHRQVQPPWRSDQRHHGGVQREDELAQADPRCRHIVEYY
jgi:hypothetical protein